MSTMFQFYERLEKENWSGEVEVTSSQGNAIILIREGKLLYAHRPLQRAIERFEAIHWIQLPPPEALGGTKTWEEFIVRLTKVNQDKYQRLSRYLKTDRLELFFRTFFWENIELFPRPYEVPPLDPLHFSFYTPRNLSKLIKESQHRIAEWPLIQKKVGSSKRVFITLISLPSTTPTEKPAEVDAVDEALIDFGGEFPDNFEESRLPYPPEQIELIKLCDGRNTVEDVIRLSQDGEYLTLRRLIDLWENGVIYPRDLQDQVFNKKTPQLFKWSQIPNLIFLSGVMGLLFAGFSYLSPPPSGSAVVSQSVVQSIEIYRHQNGRYPITLLELVKEGRITPQSFQQHDYKLVNPFEYELRIKSILSH